MHLDTLAVQALRDHEHGAVVPPIHLASTFELDPADNSGAYDYQRGANPTRAALESVLGALEDAPYAFAFASGMAATSAALSFLQAGDEVIIPASVYGGTYRLATRVLSRQGVTVRFVADLADLTAADLTPATAAVFAETPANPTLRVTDLRRTAELAHAGGARLIVDNTFMSPVLQRPLDLGADATVQSATKYLAGHSDLLAGTIATRDPELAEGFALAQKAQGGVLSPIDSYRLIQDVKTLPLRLRRQQETAVLLTEHLREHPRIARVLVPGSANAQEARIHASQAHGPGAIVSFELAPEVDRTAFLRALRIPVYAVSLGGVESLICHPATMTHEAMTPQARAQAGIGDDLLRLSVGIEAPEDLRADLDQALGAALGS